MAILPRLRDFLDQSQVPYTHHSHPIAYTAREVARTEQVPEHRVAKTVVFSGDNGFGMAVLPADSFVDLQELRADLGLTHLRLATERELEQLFPDCELGAMPPMGNLFGLPVFVDNSFHHEDTITFNAGTHRDVVYMRYRDFENLVRPVTFHFARKTAANW